MARKSGSAATKAEKLLAEFGTYTVPVPVERIAKSLGAQVRFQPLDAELSGMVYVKDGTAIIGVNSLHHPNRQRFTIAHEIAHVVLHWDKLTSEVHVDTKFLMRDEKSATGEELEEIEANNFAAALLMPSEQLKQALETTKIVDIDDDTPLDDIAKKFRVSRQALEYRIKNL